MGTDSVLMRCTIFSSMVFSHGFRGKLKVSKFERSMALSKVFDFYGSKREEEQIIRLHQQVLDLMEDSFYELSELIKTLKKQYKPSDAIGAKLHELSTIQVDHGRNIDQNCDIFLSTVEVLQQIYEETNPADKHLLNPAAFDFVYEPGTACRANIDYREKCATGGCAALSAASILWKMMLSSGALASMKAFFHALRASCMASVPVFLASLTMEALFGIFLGSIKKGQLEDEIIVLRKMVSKFKPKLREFTGNIYEANANAKRG